MVLGKPNRAVTGAADSTHRIPTRQWFGNPEEETAGPSGHYLPASQCGRRSISVRFASAGYYVART